MALVEEYTYTDIASQTHNIQLRKTRVDAGWSVVCYKLRDEGHEDLAEDWECMWEVSGVTVGYKDGNPNFPIREAFTEETARKEFERWRPTA